MLMILTILENDLYTYDLNFTLNWAPLTITNGKKSFVPYSEYYTSLIQPRLFFLIQNQMLYKN